MLKNISYTFKPGKLYILVGKSGSGKSTFLHLIADVIKPTSGEILYQNKRLCAKKVTLVLQQPFFFGDLSIADNLKISSLFSKRTKRNIKKELLIVCNVESIQNRLVSLCSGGEKARVNLIRGLLTGKPIILIDEPTAHLDALNSQKVAALLSAWAKTSVLIVTTHQPAFFNFEHSVFLSLADGQLTIYHG